MKLPVHLDLILLYEDHSSPDAGPVSGSGPWRAIVPGTINENRIEGRGDTPEIAIGGAHAMATAVLRRDESGEMHRYCPGIELDVHFYIKHMKFPGRNGGEHPAQQED